MSPAARTDAASAGRGSLAADEPWPVIGGLALVATSFMLLSNADRLGYETSLFWQMLDGRCPHCGYRLEALGHRVECLTP